MSLGPTTIPIRLFQLESLKPYKTAAWPWRPLQNPSSSSSSSPPSTSTSELPWRSTFSSSRPPATPSSSPTASTRSVRTPTPSASPSSTSPASARSSSSPLSSPSPPPLTPSTSATPFPKVESFSTYTTKIKMLFLFLACMKLLSFALEWQLV